MARTAAGVGAGVSLRPPGGPAAARSLRNLPSAGVLSHRAGVVIAPVDTHGLLEIDQRARAEELEVERSLLLQAPAGSGKTTVLSARFLALLAQVDAPEQILAITFTRKAAAEMRQRIHAALRAASVGQAIAGIDAQLMQAAAQRDRQCGWQLLHNPAPLRIQTIDALNHSLAAALPVS